MPKFFKAYKKEICFVIGLVILALIPRLLRAIFMIQPVFADEAIYIRWAQIMRAEPTMRFLPLSDGKQPLFMWCIIPLLKIINDPLIAGRLLSVMTGLGSLVGVGVFTYLLFQSKKLVYISCLFYAISPFSVFFDGMALADSMLTMLGIWSYIFAYLTIKQQRLDYAMLTGFFLGASMLTKSPSLYFVLLLPILLIFLKKGVTVKNNINLLIRAVFLLGITYTIAYGIYNILRLGPNFHMIALRNKDYVFPISQLWTNPKDPFIFHIQEILNWLWLWGPSVLLILFPLGIILRLNKYKKEILTLLALSIVPLFLNAMYAKVFTARYMLFVMPYIYIIAALALNNWLKKSYLSLVLLIFVLHALSIDYLFIKDIQSAPFPKSERTGYLEEWTSGYGIWEVSDYLKSLQRKHPDDKIVVGTEGYFGTLPDGLQMYLASYPEITVIGVGLDIKEIPKSLKESKLYGNRTFLVINDSRLRAKPDDLNLTLIAAYPKAFRTVGTKEYNLFGPRQNLLFFEVN